MKEIRDGAVRIANVHTLRGQDGGSSETLPAAWLPGAREGRLSQETGGVLPGRQGNLTLFLFLGFCLLMIEGVQL